MIRRIVQRTLVVMLVTVGSAIASAQPSTVDPIAPASGEPLVEAYPKRLVDRPVLLPEGAIDVPFGFRFGNDNSALFESELRIATPVFELHAGFSYQLSERPSTDSHWAALYARGLREIVPCRAPGLAAGVQVAAFHLGGDRPGFSPSLLALYKRKLARAIAIQPSASIGYDYGQGFDEVMVAEGNIHQLDGALAFALQLQASAAWAFELAPSVRYYQDLSDKNARYGIGSHSEQRLELAVLWAMTPNADFRFVYGRTHHSFEFASDGIALLLNIRRI